MTTLTAPKRVAERVGRRWRLLAVVCLAAGISAVVASIALGALSTAGTGTGSASTGSVALSVNSSATVNCWFGAMSPGDASTGWSSPGADKPCVFSVTYTGSLAAYIGLSAAVSGTLSPLYDGTANGLQFSISDGTHFYTSGGLINNNSAANPLFVASDIGRDNTTYTVTVNYALPKTYSGGSDASDNAYQASSTTLTLTFEAVQSEGNGTAASCSPGSRCPSAAGISWS